MAYTPILNNPQYVVVEAVVNGQQIINTFWLVHGQGGLAADGSSTLLLQSFRTAYRLLLARFYNVYAVVKYSIREAESVLNTTFPPEEPFWITVWNPFKYDELVAILPQDQGQIASVGQDLMPAHEALRVRKIPSPRRVGYFKAGYNRFCPWAEADANTVWEKFNDDFVTLMQGVMTTFNATPFDGGGANPVWRHGLFSPTLHGRVSVPLGMSIYQSCTFVGEYKVIPWVGTQVSRRFKSTGRFQGR